MGETKNTKTTTMTIFCEVQSGSNNTTVKGMVTNKGMEKWKYELYEVRVNLKVKVTH